MSSRVKKRLSQPKKPSKKVGDEVKARKLKEQSKKPRKRHFSPSDKGEQVQVAEIIWTEALWSQRDAAWPSRNAVKAAREESL